jgi:hypothetical protein
MKWFSDISHGQTNDNRRNQLIRIIENAITFQSNDNLPDKVYFTLVTPQVFLVKEDDIFSRLYQYKYYEYTNDNGPESLYNEINQCQLRQRDHQNNPIWNYPSIEIIQNRLANLQFNWVSYETLFENLPDSAISNSIMEFWDERSQLADN